ncbi:MAG: ABC transporter transmembrane domain-containing protein, partial [Opitutales bacterium]
MIDRNREIVRRYTGQAVVLPREIRKQIEEAWGGEPLQLYALSDIDSTMQLTEDWVALGPKKVAVYRSGREGKSPSVFMVDLALIREAKEIPGLTCTKISLLGESGEPVLAEIRYSQRQRRAMGALLFVLRQRIEGKEVEFKEPDEVYAEAVSKAIREAQASVAVNRSAIVWRLLGYLRPYRLQVTMGMIAAALMTAVGLVPPYLTGYIIDEVIRPFQQETLSREAAMLSAMTVIGGLAAVFLFREAMAWVRLRKMAVLGEHVARDLRNDLYDHLHSLSVSYFSSKQTGSIISRVSSDTDRIWDFIAFGVVEVSLSLLMLVGLGCVLLLLDWPLGLLMTLPVPIMLYMIYRNGIGMQRLFLRAWRKWSNLTDVLSDTIPGVRVVKAFNQEAHEKKRFGERNATVTNEFFRIHHRWTSFWPFLLLFVHAMTVAVWFFALPRILGTEPTLTAGTFVSFLLYLGMFFQPIEVFGQMSRMVNRSLSSAHRIFEVLDTEPDMTDISEPVRLSPVEGQVTFDRVFFAYDPARPVLKEISFQVEPGEMIGLVGPSGSGKTTIINLIARFFDPVSGCIRVDGHDLRHLDSGLYRQQIGMVLQDPYLFHG